MISFLINKLKFRVLLDITTAFIFTRALFNVNQHVTFRHIQTIDSHTIACGPITDTVRPHAIVLKLMNVIKGTMLVHIQQTVIQTNNSRMNIQ